MKIVGLTGGIGSGKSTVAKMFADLNIPIYVADDEAKKLMVRSKVIRRKLIALFGEMAYIDEGLNRPYLATRIFNNQELLKQMNAIVHPKVKAHFKRWVNKQNAPYCIKEVAILFEHGGYKECDAVITVIAPLETRIERVLQRDDTTRERITAIIRNQWQDDERIKHSDYVISNDKDLDQLSRKVREIHEKIKAGAQ